MNAKLSEADVLTKSKSNSPIEELYLLIRKVGYLDEQEKAVLHDYKNAPEWKEIGFLEN